MDDTVVSNPPKKKREKMIPVRLIRAKGKSALVQWGKGYGLRRAYVPTGKVENGKCAESALDAGAPHGEDWDNVVKDAIEQITSERIAAELHLAGIWTKEDLRNRPKQAERAIIKANSDVLKAIYNHINRK
jgi:hypothetical protein